MTQTALVAEQVESVIHKAFSMKGDDFGFSLPNAMLVGVKHDEYGNVQDVATEVASHPDIYTLLEEVTSEMVNGFTAIGIVTCGWAAPIDAGGLPSQNPNRRRVRLVIVSGQQGTASVLRFQDDAENPITDEGEAMGPLAEAVEEVATLL